MPKGPVVRWTPPGLGDARGNPYPPSRPLDPERGKALIVMGLSCACTIMSLYDLFLLARGT
jgi:hypothetical protein